MENKPLHGTSQPVVVITGASSGIGRETALMFARQGAKVVAAARNRDALEEVARQVERLGGQAKAVVTDVSRWEEVENLAREAVTAFGRIDVWVNNAAVSLYATVEDASVEEIRRVLDVNLMGQIHGVKAALPHLKAQGHGVVINVASVLAKRSVPLQAAYCASKHAVKGFTESLRMELESEGGGVRVALILPSSINTPLFEHARSKLGVRPKPLPPVYEPRAVAEAILFAARHPLPEITVGGAGKMLELLERIDTGLADRYLLQGGRGFRGQQGSKPADSRDNLFEPVSEPGGTTGSHGKRSRSVSSYTRFLEQHPGRKRAAAAVGLATLGLLAARGLRSRRSRAAAGAGSQASRVLPSEQERRQRART